LPALRETARNREDGISRVIALSSLEGIHPEAGLAVYSATKAAMISLVNSINVEERLNGVLATAISPGFVDTEMSDWVAEVIPKETMISVDDIVRCVALLLDLSPQCLLPHLMVHRRDANAFQA
jgi:short-subunit dehydrogenase